MDTPPEIYVWRLPVWLEFTASDEDSAQAIAQAIVEDLPDAMVQLWNIRAQRNAVLEIGAGI